MKKPGKYQLLTRPPNRADDRVIELAMTLEQYKAHRHRLLAEAMSVTRGSVLRMHFQLELASLRRLRGWCA